MKKILIAGSTGFVGRYLEQIIKSHNSFLVKTINRDQGDYLFKDLDSIEESFDLIYVLFALLPSDNFTLIDYLNVNVELTNKLISKFPNARFVFTSTISVYENSSIIPCQEMDLGLNISDYAKSKLKAEDLFSNYNAIVLRLSSIYGPGMKENTFLPIIIKSAIEKQEIILIGNDQRKQHYSHVNNVVEYLFKAGEANDCGIFNAVDSRSYTNLEVAKMVSKQFNNIPIKHIVDDKKYYSYQISNEKWINCFKTNSVISLEEGIKRYIDYKIHA